jgi:acyl-CoA synthetase (AMP-forming)/AMP-acid ligase II
MLIEGGPLQAPAAPLPDLLRAGVEAAPAAVAIASADRRMSWRELEAASSTLARAYRALGLEPGDRVASLMPNRIDLVVHYLACFEAGLVATPLNYRYTHREIDHALEVSGAAALLAHAERAEDLAASRLAGELRVGTISYAGPGLAAANAFEELVGGRAGAVELGPPPAPSDPAAIFFTSGSTGPAKGVTHTHETLRWMIASAVAAFELSADDVFLPGSSMSHIGSFLWALSTLAVGGRVVVARRATSPRCGSAAPGRTRCRPSC